MTEKEEKKRPWREDKRSWILYWDKLKEFDNIISDSVEGNRYIFDCETVRLSIWSEKWQVFADIGISRFLDQVRNKKRGYEVESLRATRIFYKGIELQEKYKEIDAGLIEFIDIKGELSKNLINMSRGNLTPDGERYLETEMYPGLLDGVHKVLLHLGKNSKQNVNFVEKIKKIFERKCEQIIRDVEVQNESEDCYQEFIAFVVTVSVLSYFACRDEWNLTELLAGHHEENGEEWLQLIGYINEKLDEEQMKNVRIKLAKMTNFFNITVYSETYKKFQRRNIRADGRKGGCFSEIFSGDKHWAIRQVRRDQYSGWKMQLIQLREESERLYNKLIAVPKNSILDDELEQWADELCDAGNVLEIQIDSSQQFIMNWLLKNIPTVGMFCSNHGNIRVSIFSSRIYPSIYMNKGFKHLIMERIFKYAGEGIERFSTIVWQGREFLSFRELPFSLFFVKRGYLSQNSYRKCIVPIHGDRFMKWNDSNIKNDLCLLKNKLESLLGAADIRAYLYNVKWNKLQRESVGWISKYVNTADKEVIVDIVDEFYEYVLERLKERKFECFYTLDKLLEINNERHEEWEKIYEIMVELFRAEQCGGEDDRWFEQMITNPEFDSLCDAWFYIFVAGLPEIKNNFGSDIRQFFYKDDSKREEEKIIFCIKDKGLYHNEETVLRKDLQDYKKELIDLIFEVEMDPIRSRFQYYAREFPVHCTNYKKEYEEYRRKNVNGQNREDRRQRQN